MGVDEEFVSLHRYFLAANQQRVQFQQVLQDHAAEHGGGPFYAGENWNESWLWMSYWYATYASASSKSLPAPRARLKVAHVERLINLFMALMVAIASGAGIFVARTEIGYSRTTAWAFATAVAVLAVGGVFAAGRRR